KTGTLTKGEFGVVDIVNSKKQIAKREILQIAASLEQQSSHFIGQSIVKFGKEQKVSLLPVTNFKNFSGRGVVGRIRGMDYWLGNETFAEEKSISLAGQELTSQGKTVILLGNKKEILGLLALSDKIRPESFRAVSDLHNLGIKVAMLTGDNEQVGKTVAKELKIDNFFANVLPEDKYKHIKKLQDEGNRVMMVGDGVNDAPALTQANVGVAVGAGTDVAVEAGDVVLTRNNPEDIVKLVILSKKVFRKMQQNLIWATGYNLLAIPAAAGLFSPWGIFLRPEIGAILMSLSSVIVVINAITLKKARLSS
ncbi:HAD-IC family P-type ATPase, partial [Candidatus Gottesmanbacteria bacterium]|nr:HAD-IC family P-type ATPase [Candidatus Gottesmanbacteria bacterium]